jgi:adenine-specific DNA methylase
LAEVDFPVAKVSVHAAREKSIRHGHPSTLHLWWARRPLAACRAMLMALLLPDPCDSDCPAEFKRQARRLLSGMPNCGKTTGDAALRTALLSFIADFANWDNSAKPAYLDCARGLVRAAHGEEPPLVVDPFAGGGSIPLEALRLGCDAFASDLNPVACLILKVLLEDIPRHGPALADELRRVGKQIKEAAEKELAEFYPPDPDGAQAIAYLWARTVRCESPKCGAEIPLVRSFWLCKKANRKRALRYGVIRPRGALPRVEPEIFEPKRDSEVPAGTVTRAKAKCLCCGTVLAPERVRAQLCAQHGGADAIFDDNGQRIGGARLQAVVTLKKGEQGRQYRLAADRDYAAVRKAAKTLAQVAAMRLPNGLSPIPDEPTPAGGGSGAGRAFSVRRYGMNAFGDLFTTRQKLALLTLGNVIQQAGISAVIKDLLGLVIDRVASRSSSLCLWRYHADQEKVEHVFGRQALPIVWDFAEAMVLSHSTGSFSDGVGVVASCVQSLAGQFASSGQSQQADACHQPLPADSCGVWFTDPPYYDAIPYSDLSDFFFVWLRRTLPDHPLLRSAADPREPLTPKGAEIVQDEVKQAPDGHPKDKFFFESAMQRAFTEGRRVLRNDGVGSVVFAHKTTEGWEALISGMLAGGWTVTASWPVTTELANRLRARESAALSASVHLVCRPRPKDAGVGGWEEILRELPKRIGDWMERLSGEGIRGADLVFSCIGPALELFSRYEHVETAEGRNVKLPEFLEKIWEVVGRSALQQVLGTAEARARNSAAGALEEDARLTALFLWTLQSTERQNGGAAEDEAGGEDQDDEEAPGRPAGKGYTLIYDVARRFAQPLGIHLEDWEGRIIEIEKGVVRLIPVLERSGKLLGPEGAQAMAQAIERSRAIEPQLLLFPEQSRVREGAAPAVRGRGRGPSRDRETAAAEPRAEATTLDRVHAAMLLQASGHAAALRALLKTETERSPDFLRLANALSALYPKDSEEKRLLDAMLLASPRR